MLVFFFDEAHLLFEDAPAALVERIELVVRLVRSKGVGVYFVTQNPLDIPDTVLAQLGNRVQHALRAFTPRDQKAVKAAASTMRANPKLDVETAIGELAVGEALVSPARREGPPERHRARVRAAAGQPDRPDHAGAAQGAARELARRRGLRRAGRPRVGVREAQGPRRRERRAARAASATQPDGEGSTAERCRTSSSATRGRAAATTKGSSRWPRAARRAASARRSGARSSAACSARSSAADAAGAEGIDGIRHQRPRHRPRAARRRARAAAARGPGALGRGERLLAAHALCRRARRVEAARAVLVAAEGPVAPVRDALLDAGARRARASPPARHRVEGVHAAHGAAPARDRARDDPRLHRRGRRAGPLRVRERARGARAAAR